MDNSRGDEQMGSTWNYLDVTALGRMEEWEDSPEGYPQTPRQVVELARRVRQLLVFPVVERRRSGPRSAGSAGRAERRHPRCRQHSTVTSLTLPCHERFATFGEAGRNRSATDEVHHGRRADWPGSESRG
jgi:hypothetical protein